MKSEQVGSYAGSRMEQNTLQSQASSKMEQIHPQGNMPKQTQRETPRQDTKKIITNKKGFSALHEKIENPNSEKKEGDTPSKWRSKKIWIIIASIIAFCFFGSMFMYYLIVRNRPTAVLIRQRKTRKPISPTKDVVATQNTVQFTDKNKLGKDKSLQFYGNQIQVQTNGRRLQQTSENIDSQGDKNYKSGQSLQIRDKFTGITVSITTLQGKVNVGVPIGDLISYTLTNQPQSEETESDPRNLQETIKPQNFQEETTTKTTYYNLPQRVEQEVKRVLSQRDPLLKIKLGETYDAKYSVKEKSFTIVNQTKTQMQEEGIPSKTASLHNPKDTPVITNLLNQEEIAKAAGKVVDQVLNRVKEILTKDNIELLQKTANIKLPVKEEKEGKPSKYADQPEDIVKLCTGVSSDIIRCTKDGFNSGLLNVTLPAEQKSDPQATSTLLLHTSLAL